MVEFREWNANCQEESLRHVHKCKMQVLAAVGQLVPAMRPAREAVRVSRLAGEEEEAQKR